MTDDHRNAATNIDDVLRRADPALNDDLPRALEAALLGESLAAESGRPEDAARAGAWAVRHLYNLGQLEAALNKARALLPSAKERADSALQIELARMIALAAPALRRFDAALEGVVLLQALLAECDDAALVLRGASAVAACLAEMGNPWQAAEVLDHAYETFGEAGEALLAVNVAASLCEICGRAARQLSDLDGDAGNPERLRWLRKARQAGASAKRALLRAPHPAFEAYVNASLVELRLLEGDIAGLEAEILRQVESAQALGLDLMCSLLEVYRADLLFQQNRADPALQLLDRVLAEPSTQDHVHLVGHAHRLAYRICRAHGRVEEALQHLEAQTRIERDLSVRVQQFQARLMVSRSEEQRARRQAEQARLEAQILQEQATRLTDEAQRDALTGLFNRRHLERWWQQVEPGERPLVLAQIDVDHFKRVNDGYGHAAGDAVLVQLARMLRQLTRADDVQVRQGGEEFVLVLPGASRGVAEAVCERIRRNVEGQAIALPDGRELHITISLGLAAAPPHDLAALLGRADAALYEAKRGGRNRLVWG